MDALTLLSSDHRKVESLFQDYKLAATPDMKKRCVDQMILELSVHAGIEELTFYPRVKTQVIGGPELIEESLEEHQRVKEMLAELERMKPEDAAYDARVAELTLSVQHHVEEEEDELFPRVRMACSVQDMEELGRELEEAKRSAPTHPHPKAPTEGSAARAAGMAAGAVDRARDMAHPDEVIREEVREHMETGSRD